MRPTYTHNLLEALTQHFEPNVILEPSQNIPGYNYSKYNNHCTQAKKIDTEVQNLG